MTNTLTALRRGTADLIKRYKNSPAIYRGVLSVRQTFFGEPVYSVALLFFVNPKAPTFDFSLYDYVVDAVDTVSAKLCIIENAYAKSVPVISSMGAGNKVDPTAFEVADIYETSVCPLARVMRYELKKRGIKRLKVVYSKEPPVSPDPQALSECLGEGTKKQPPGSNAFVPSVAGLIIASEVVKELTGYKKAR